MMLPDSSISSRKQDDDDAVFHSKLNEPRRHGVSSIDIDETCTKINKELHSIIDFKK